MDTATALSEAAFEAPLPKNVAISNPSFNEYFPFMKLPTEIRVLIYKELLIRDPSPKLSFCQGNHQRVYKHRFKIFVHPAILRACRAIYREALPFLYTDNIFELLCILRQTEKQRLWYRTLGPSPLSACPNPHASTYVKQAFLTYVGVCLERSDIIQFPICWPKIEHELLELYPNIEYILVQIRQLNFNSICLKLVRRHQSKRAPEERVQNYMAVLEDFDLQQERNRKDSYPGQNIRHILGDLCTAIVQDESQGQMQRSVFAVQAVRWGRGFLKLHPGWEEFDLLDIYLGCERCLSSGVEGSDGSMEADGVKGNDGSVKGF